MGRIGQIGEIVRLVDAWLYTGKLLPPCRQSRFHPPSRVQRALGR
jgi:hypothetical protein